MRLFSTKDSSKETGLFSKRRTAILIAAVACTLAVTLAPAQSKAEIHEDALFEFSLGAGLSFASGDLSDFYNNSDTLGADGGFNLHASAGLFVSDLMTVGLALDFNQFGLQHDTTNFHHRFYSVNGYLKYHFGYEAKATPYIRLQAGLVFPNMATPLGTAGRGLRELSYDPALTFSAALGTRVSTSEWGGLYLELAYRMMKVKDKSESFDRIEYMLPSDAPMIQLTAGFSFDIGPKS